MLQLCLYMHMRNGVQIMSLIKVGWSENIWVIDSDVCPFSSR